MKVLMAFTKTSGGSGKIEGEFTTNVIFKADPLDLFNRNAIYMRNILKQACLTKNQFLEYANGKPKFAWNVLNPIRYERKFELPKRMPQSWCYIDDNTILLAIKKNWGDLILDGKKTKEIRATHPKIKEEEK